MGKVIEFNRYIDINYIEGAEVFEEDKLEETSNKILDDYKEIIVNQIIQQFGLSKILNIYKKGGNVTTLNNAENNTFSNEEDHKRYTKKFDRKDYETNVYGKNWRNKEILEAAGLSTLRFNTKKYTNDQIREAPATINVKRNNPDSTQKSKIKINTTNNSRRQINNFIKKSVDSNKNVIDGYNRNIKYDIKNNIHIDHIISAKELHFDKELKLYMSDKERAILALREENLAYTFGSANQSKSDKNLLEWSKTLNKRDSTKTNEEFYNLNNKDIKKEYNNSRNYIEKRKAQAKRNYYTKESVKTSSKQGLKVGLQQMIGLLLYELQNEFTKEMKIYFKNFKNFGTAKNRIQKFKEATFRIKGKIYMKRKKIFSGFSDGFISGFISNLITIIVNTFITTSKRIVRLITETFTGVYKAVKVLISNNNSEENVDNKFREATKLFASSIIAAIGGILTESLILYLKTTPFALFSEMIGTIIGGILTGISISSVLYIIDDFRGFIDSIKNIFAKDDFTQKELRHKYKEVSSKINNEYKLILDKILKEYYKLNSITKKAFDRTLTSSERFGNSIRYATEFDVETSKIVNNDLDIDNYFFN